MRDLDAFERYIGRPFVDGGRGPDAYDCWGLVLAVYRDVYGVALRDYDIGAAAVRDIAGAILDGQRSDLWETTPTPTRAPAVVVMALHPDHLDLVNHCGVWVGGTRVLHTVKAIGAHWINPASPVWARRVKGYMRWISTTP